MQVISCHKVTSHRTHRSRSARRPTSRKPTNPVELRRHAKEAGLAAKRPQPVQPNSGPRPQGRPLRRASAMQSSEAELFVCTNSWTTPGDRVWIALATLGQPRRLTSNIIRPSTDRLGRLVDGSRRPDEPPSILCARGIAQISDLVVVPLCAIGLALHDGQHIGGQ